MNLIKLNPLDGAIYKTGKDGRVFIFNQGWMFDPVTMLVVGGTVMSAAGQLQAGQAASSEAKSQQAMSEYNAKLEERNAKNIEAKTAFDQRRQAEEANRRMSSLRAGFGASGAVSTAGSPLLIQATQAKESELENAMIGYQGMEEATAARSQATMDKMQAKLYGKQAGSARTAGFIGAGASLLSGFGTAGMIGGWGKAGTGIGQGGTTGIKLTPETNYGQGLSRNFY